MHIFRIYNPIIGCHIRAMMEYQTEIVALGLIDWTVAQVIALIFYRTSIVIFTQKPANSFSASGNDLTAFGERMTRSYANSTEFVPLILGVLLYAIATNQTNLTDGLAFYVLAARMAHSSLHVLSTSQLAVGIRSLLLWIQIGISMIWILLLARTLL